MITQPNDLLIDTSNWAIWLLCFSIVWGIIIHFKPLWGFRSYLSGFQSLVLGVTTGVAVVSFSLWASVACLIIQAYRLFNTLRIVKGRTQPAKLHSRTFRSELVLDCTLLIVIAIEVYASNWLQISTVLLAIAAEQLLLAILYYRHTHDTLAASRLVLPKKFTNASNLPSLTIALPARNETGELADTLHNILPSNYPKLEVLVLDDCSQDKTSDIIRSFAHKGVRFVQGTPPPSSWLAKNHAYNQLLDEASGEYILFCGVDVRFQPQSIRQLIEVCLNDHRNMISIMPIRHTSDQKQFLLQPMRYWRELALPHPFSKTPPSLSTCWIAKRAMLQENGGFAAVRNSIRPERYIARGVAREGHYSFIVSSSGLGIWSIKSLQAQWHTALRTRYPEHRSRPESVMFASIVLILLSFGMVASVVASAYYGNFAALLLSVSALLFIVVTHATICAAITQRTLLRDVLILPVSVSLELAAIHYSMWAYEFSEVIWKGRNVCMPVLRVDRHLPKLD